MDDRKPGYLERMQNRAAEVGRDLARQDLSSHGKRGTETRRMARQMRQVLPDGTEVITEEVIIIEESRDFWEGWQ